MEQLRDIYNGKIKTGKNSAVRTDQYLWFPETQVPGTYEVWEEKILKGRQGKT